MGHHRAFLRKTFHVLGFAREERFWNQQWEIGVLNAGLLEHAVQDVLHLFPNRIAVRLDHHAAAHVRLLCQVGFHHQLIIPLRIIHAAFRQLFQFFCHCVVFIFYANLGKIIESLEIYLRFIAYFYFFSLHLH